MSYGMVMVDTFSSADDLKGKNRTYENVKAVVLKAGRFSIFEATNDIKSAHIFQRLLGDPEVETWDMGYPWTGVRKRESK